MLEEMFFGHRLDQRERIFMNEEIVGTPAAPRYYQGPSAIRGDYHVRIRYFTYETDEGLVVGRNTNHTFTIERAARDVWPYIKDFNLWQNGYGYYYTGVVGDLEGKEFYIAKKDTPLANKVNETMGLSYTVLKVVPEHIIVIRQGIPEDGSTGGISPGFHVITLNEQSDRTLVTIYTEHARRTQGKNVVEALASFQAGGEETLRKFRDSFIPMLKQLVCKS